MVWKSFVRRKSYRNTQARSPLIVSIPHAGEAFFGPNAYLKSLPEHLQMFDVDRYVDELYEPVLSDLSIPSVVTPYHRYVCDLNRFQDDVDAASVIGSSNPIGKFPRGLHWSQTTLGEKLLLRPYTQNEHFEILETCFFPFHHALKQTALDLRFKNQSMLLYHLDLHSMPSFGTQEHRDPGEWRADMVISDQDGKSTDPEFMKVICEAASSCGFTVTKNWPYKGGRITEAYGKPSQGWNTVQIELNRKLYMDETTKKKVPFLFEATQARLAQMITRIHRNLTVGDVG